MHDRVSTRVTRRGVVVAGAVALSGCSGLGIGGNDFEFPDGDPSDDQKAIARTFVERVHDGEYEAATEPFTDEMTESMDPAQLERTWAQNVGDLGSYEEISELGVVEHEDVDAVFARVQCAEGYYALQVTTDGDRIAGLFFKNKVTE